MLHNDVWWPLRFQARECRLCHTAESGAQSGLCRCREEAHIGSVSLKAFSILFHIMPHLY